MKAGRQGFAMALALVLTIVGATAAAVDDRTGSGEETARKVRRALERLPYYGVYDFLAFKVGPGAITLQGGACSTLKDGRGHTLNAQVECTEVVLE